MVINMKKYLFLFITSCSLALQEKTIKSTNSNNNPDHDLGIGIHLMNSITSGTSDEGRRNFSVKCPDLTLNDLICTNCEIKSITPYGDQEFNVEILPLYTGQLVNLNFDVNSSCASASGDSYKFKDRANDFQAGVTLQDRIQGKNLHDETYTNINTRVYFQVDLNFDYIPHEGTELKVQFGTCGKENDDDIIRYEAIFDLYEFVKEKITTTLPVKDTITGAGSPFDFNESLKDYDSGLVHWDRQERKLSFLFDKYKIAQETNRTFKKIYTNDNEKPLEYCILFFYRENQQDLKTQKIELRKVLNIVGTEMINFNSSQDCPDEYFITMAAITDQNHYPHSHCKKNKDLVNDFDENFSPKYIEWDLNTLQEDNTDFDLSYQNSISNWYSYFYGDIFSTIPIDYKEFFDNGILNFCDSWNTDYFHTDQIDFNQFKARFIKKHINTGYIDDYHHNGSFYSTLAPNFFSTGANESVFCKTSSFLNHSDYGNLKSSFIKAQLAYKSSFAEVTASHNKIQENMNEFSSLRNGLIFYSGSGELILSTKVEIEKKQNYNNNDIVYDEDFLIYGNTLLESASVASRNQFVQNFYSIDHDKKKSYQLVSHEQDLLVSAVILDGDSYCNVFNDEKPYIDNCSPSTHQLLKTTYSYYDPIDVGNEKPFSPFIDPPKNVNVTVKNNLNRKTIYNHEFNTHLVDLHKKEKKFKTIFDLSEHKKFERKILLIHTQLPLWIRGLFWWWNNGTTNFENLGPVFSSENSDSSGNILGIPMLYRPIMMPFINYGSVMVDYAY